MEKQDIVVAMKSEIKSLKVQWEKMRDEVYNKKREINRKQRALTLFLGDDKSRKAEVQTLQIAVPNSI